MPRRSVLVVVALGQWQTIDMLVCVKAYPSLSTTYREAVCVAGVRFDTPKPEWIRLFPVNFRELPQEQQFAKYQWIRLRARQHSTDRRVETWRPDVDSIELGDAVQPGGTWAHRRPLVEPLVGPTMCALNFGRSQGRTGPSLGLVRPAEVRKIDVARETPWTADKRAIADQQSLLSVKTELEQPAHAFFYAWRCEEPTCSGHRQKIVDWELGEAYRRWRMQGEELVEAIRAKWLDLMCAADRDTLFFVGDQHRRPGKFLNLGTWYPKRQIDAGQLQMFGD